MLTCYSVLTPSLVYVLCVNAIGAVVGPYVLTVGVGITGVQARQDVFGHDVTLSQVNELVPRWSWTTASSCTWSFVDFGIIGMEGILSERYG